MVRHVRSALLLVVTTLCAKPLYAQDAPPSAWARANDASSVTTSTRVNWLGAWSPLRPVADLPRGELRAPFGPGVLDAPSPLRGAFILAGAPGAIVHDLLGRGARDSARFGEMRLQHASESGSYHRPLDVVQGTATQVSGIGWSPVGSRGMAMGRFVVDQENEDTSSFTQRVSPSWSSPFIATDSVRPPMVRTRARAEGALGLRLGAYDVGLSAGVDSREHNSLDFPLRRTGRWASPAAALGVERSVPWLGARINARVGAYARWTEMAETNVLNPSPLSTIIYTLQGMDEPQGIPVANATLFVRNDRRATADGLTASFELLGTSVVAVYERGNRADDQYRLITSRVRPTDSWRTSGSESRVQLARDFGAGVRAMVVAHRVTLNGKGYRNDLAGLAVLGGDTQNAVEGDVRYTRGAWMVGVTGGMTQRTQDRQDYVAQLTSHIEQVTPFVSGEVARAVRGVSVAVGASFASTSPTAALPAASRGPNYRRLIAPDLAYDAAEASASALWLTVRRAVRGHDVFVQLRTEQASPTSVLASRLQPSGDRTRWQVGVGYRP